MQKLEAIKRNVCETMTLQTLKNWDGEWQKITAFYSDDTVAEVDALFAERRRELSE